MHLLLANKSLSISSCAKAQALKQQSYGIFGAVARYVGMWTDSDLG